MFWANSVLILNTTHKIEKFLNNSCSKVTLKGHCAASH